MEAARHYIRWIPERDNELRALVEEGKRDREIAAIMGTGYEAIRHRRHDLGIHRRDRRDIVNNTDRWPEERVETLKRMWGEGASAPVIAAALGDGLTRMAVIGKAHRLKLPARAQRESKCRKKREVRVTRLAPLRRPKLRLIVDNTADQDIPHHQRKSIMELTRVTCRWPVGDPGHVDFFYCGGESVDGLPYCCRHYFVSIGKVASRVVEKLAAQRAHENQT